MSSFYQSLVFCFFFFYGSRKVNNLKPYLSSLLSLKLNDLGVIPKLLMAVDRAFAFAFGSGSCGIMTRRRLCLLSIGFKNWGIFAHVTRFTCCFSFFQNIGSHKEKAGERRGVGAVEVPSIISSGKILLKSTNWIQLNMQLSTLKAPRNAGVRRKQRTFFQPKYNDHRGRRSG